MIDRESEVRIEEIHRTLSRTHGFHGFRPLLLYSVSGFAVAVALAVELFGISHTNAETVAAVWLAAAAIVVVLVAGVVIVPALLSPSRFVRVAAKGVSMQLAPVLVVGLAASFAMISRAAAISYLPSVWAATMAVGIVSMAPYLPAAVWVSSIWYFASAAVLFRFEPRTAAGLNAVVAVVFAAGHAMTGFFLTRSGGDGRCADR
jgi:hypothetical protein